jgi:peptidoglycan/xylan/chitin deacetylase (PgdA/CDA1 family)
VALNLASVCYNALRLTGVTTVARRVTSGGIVLCYHNVVGSNDDGAANTLGLHMPLAAFERQMRWLRDHYTVVPLEELVGRVLRGRSLRGVAAVTFDDGYVGVFEHAWPLLRDLGLSATVFIVADAPGREDGFWWDDPDVLRVYSPDQEQRWLTTHQGDRARIVESVVPTRPPWQPRRWCRPATWETIASAAGSGGLQFGVHSATHRSLPVLNDADLNREVVESRDVIQRNTGVTPVFFTYPYGLWNDRVRRAVRSAGYRAAFTLAPDNRTTKRDPWTIPRLNVPAGIDDAAFEAWTAGLSLRRWQDA